MRLAVRQAGSGPPVLLLHGLFGQARNFGTLQASLARSHQVVALDLRNHGSSPHAGSMAYADLAADVAETLTALGLGPCAVIGHSMGGKVAMRLALQSPGWVARLLVGDIAPIAYRGSFAAYAAAMQGLTLTPGLTRAAADAALATSIADPGLRGFLLQNLQTGAAPAWRIGLAEIIAGLPSILGWPDSDAAYRGPTLFMAGARSDYIGVEAGPAIRRWFPTARQTILAEAGHWLHVDNAAGFLSIVTSFLDEDAAMF